MDHPTTGDGGAGFAFTFNNCFLILARDVENAATVDGSAASRSIDRCNLLETMEKQRLFGAPAANGV